VDVERCHLTFGDFDTLLVAIGVKATGDRQSGGCPGIGDQLHDDLMAGQRLATPIPGDEGEQAMLDAVPVDADAPYNAARVSRIAGRRRPMANQQERFATARIGKPWQSSPFHPGPTDQRSVRNSQ
jgi:hypothetical protein